MTDLYIYAVIAIVLVCIPAIIIGALLSCVRKKCRYHKICEGFKDDAYICNHDFDACNNCGKFREIKWQEKHK